MQQPHVTELASFDPTAPDVAPPAVLAAGPLTRRQLLYVLLLENRELLDYHLTGGLEDAPPAARLVLKLAGGLFKLDIAEQPSSLLLLLLRVLSDDAIDLLWEQIRPMAQWVDRQVLDDRAAGLLDEGESP